MAEYKGRQIGLLPGQRDDGKWTCQFDILEFGKAAMGSRKYYADGVFDSKEDAETAAIKKAKYIIDSN